MSISTVKAALWIANLGAFGTLGYTLYDWKEHEGEKMARRATAEIQSDWLDNIQRPELAKQDIYDYDKVEANFFNLNWTGKAPPPPVVEVVDTVVDPTKLKATPIDDILEVLYVQVDTSIASNSTSLIKYTDAALTIKFKEAVNIFEGDELPEPHNGWVVDAIVAEGVLFRRGDESEGVEPQLAMPAVAVTGNLIVKVGEGGALVPVKASFPGALAGFIPPSPLNTMKVGKDRYKLGTEDLATIGENYLEILSNEVRQRPFRNPRTGRWEGIEILSVSPGSIAAQHGVEAGDVIKSINGTPVNSAQDAIQYVKNNADMYEIWTVVIENAGKEKTVVYQKS